MHNLSESIMKFIKYIAIYYRKSRGDEEKALDKHKVMLRDMAAKYNWKYVEFEEIATSDSIFLRPKMQKLLKEVSEEAYDAVVCMDYDRLSRGDLGDQDKVKKTFQKSNTFIITPQKIYDLNDELDDTYSDFQGLLARQEYKMIVKRFQRGKKIGARLGNWVNGRPPYGYEYEKYRDKFNEKGLVVNDEKKVIYNYMVQEALKGTICNRIATELNKRNIPSPKNKQWYASTVHDILTNETYLGKIISNKSKGNGAKIQKENAIPLTYLPKSEWVVVENCHEPLISEENFNIIKDNLERRRLFPVGTRAGKHDLSGLIKCSVCNRNMQIQFKDSGNHQIKKCTRIDKLGNKCPNRGGIVIPTEKVWEAILKYKEKLLKLSEANINNKSASNNLKAQIKIKYDTLEKYRLALENARDAYDLGDYNRNEFLNRKNKWDIKIQKTKDEIFDLEKKLNLRDAIAAKELLKNLEQLIEIFPQLKTSKEKNDALKLIIDNITWRRIGNEEGTFEINFL